jgi:hypothetical protein
MNDTVNGAKSGRFGLVHYARILHRVMQSPCTQHDVAQAIGRSVARVREILWRLENMGRVHVVDWAPSPRVHGCKSPVFALGPGKSMPYPGEWKRPPMGSTLARTKPRPELIAFVSILRALDAGASRADLGQASGVSHHRFPLLLRYMASVQMVHLCEWRRRDGQVNGTPTEVYKFGPGENAKRPARLTQRQRDKRSKQRKQAAKEQAMADEQQRADEYGTRVVLQAGKWRGIPTTNAPRSVFEVAK